MPGEFKPDHLSQFCSEIFPTVDFHIGEPISFIPQEYALTLDTKWHQPTATQPTRERVDLTPEGIKMLSR